MKYKLFIGAKVRELRESRNWKLEPCAKRLGVSTSYLSQIESNNRPVTPRVLLAMMDAFEAPAELFELEDDHRLLADLRQALAETGAGGSHIPLSELKRAAVAAPALVKQFVALHRSHERLNERLKLTDEAVALDETMSASSLLPYEEVRDYFSDRDNYVDSLDTAAEALAEAVGILPGAPVESLLSAYLRRTLDVGVTLAAVGDTMRRYDPARRTLEVNAAQPEATRVFQITYHLVSTLLRDVIEDELAKAGFRTRAAVDVCRVGLANYAAGALLMPYGQFAQAARRERHDLDRLTLMFHISLEQACHRLSTLQRPGARGVPIYFVRLDHAGNITKRHSATRFRFARFGGACPLWNVHEAIGTPDKYLVQVAEMPDGARYLCVARSIIKPSGSYLIPNRRFVLGVGCELRHADQLVYSEGVDLKGPPARIGVSCRICERDNCTQRAFPPLDRPLVVPADERRIIPFRLGPDIATPH